MSPAQLTLPPAWPGMLSILASLQAGVDYFPPQAGCAVQALGDGAQGVAGQYGVAADARLATGWLVLVLSLVASTTLLR